MGYEPFYIYMDEEEGLSGFFDFTGKYKMPNLKEFINLNETCKLLTEEDDGLVIALSGDLTYSIEKWVFNGDGTLSRFMGWYDSEKNRWRDKNFRKKRKGGGRS